MPLIINSVAYNKAIRNGKILNALHAEHHTWLQNHWTGTANASTSILSQDGQVVATNLVTSPKPLAAGWGASAGASLADYAKGMAVVNQKTPDFYTSDIRAQYALVLQPSTKYHVYARLADCSAAIASPGKGHSVIMVLTESAVTTEVGPKNFSFTTEVGPKNFNVGAYDGSFVTGNTGATTIRLYTGANAGDTAVWKDVVVCTQSDWAAMQARGITWFDGDSTFNVVTAKASVEIRGAF